MVCKKERENRSSLGGERLVDEKTPRWFFLLLPKNEVDMYPSLALSTMEYSVLYVGKRPERKSFRPVRKGGEKKR